MSIERWQYKIEGRVQGVGFRPFVYRLAHQMKLTGWVRNDTSGVLIEVQGEGAADFGERLMHELPDLARVDFMKPQLIRPVIEEEFFILESDIRGTYQTLVAPDTATCRTCLDELFDPKSRYFLYPFLNCTQCGPRFSITSRLPYDRCHTSMSPFKLCEACRAEYTNPEDRRYHAQPTACTQCGPELSMPIAEIAARIQAGEIIALKGQGGYQLIADANNETVVRRLRERKQREAKPFAVMMLNVTDKALDKRLQSLMEHPSRPVVLIDGAMSEAIAPGLNQTGVMLPYTPMHYLLFYHLMGAPKGKAWLSKPCPWTLVVTSANISGEPLIIDDTEAQQALSGIADVIVTYNRTIVTREDDSVMHVINNKPRFIRRARGFVPDPIDLGREMAPVLALGGHLKNTFCIIRGREAFVSQHIGGMTNPATIKFYYESLKHWLAFLNVSPERVAHDLHPDFYTTQIASEFGVPTYGVQHHHAHCAAVMAEHRLQGPLLGLALDGYGYGLKGEAWGGELMRLDGKTMVHLSALESLQQPGGPDPWRMAGSVLHRLGRKTAPDLAMLLDSGAGCVPTSSCGRLFDAAAGLLGVCEVNHYEGQAAMMLEALVTCPEVLEDGWRNSTGRLDFFPLLTYLADCNDPVRGANLFHGTLIAGLAEWISWTPYRQLVLSGGCFSNRYLAEGLAKALEPHGMGIYMPERVPPNDGGIALGQAFVIA